MIPDWLEALRAARGHESAALVTVLSTEGSAPRRAGTRMTVTAGDSIGTIGGGALEHRAIEQARKLLDLPPGSWRVQDWPLGPLLGQCCGGQVRLLLEHVAHDPDGWDWTDYVERRKAVASLIVGPDRIDRVPAEYAESGVPTPLPPRAEKPGPGTSFIEPDDRRAQRALLMFGAGHVGVAIAQRLPRLPFRLSWFDPRENRAIPGVSLQDEDAMVACAEQAEPGSAVLVFTHDHGLDYRITAAALRSQAAFVGLIGSDTKRARFLKRLNEEQLDTARLTCPIGVPGIEDKAPDIIAIAVIAQLLMLETGA
ncbi:xanthine dehydrogenase accessory protein XdhC [Sphingomonas sp. HITSZ_GF]|uniref:xanthine dehydrogenase accessory protein XdhC n=1 Tax=Sphingomonas sp. HITSZ_GF TaxID=3037247 RepID=UPI00240E5960|nr:xanthine dehydrogenase accessory protein XdhC [Sphingomonas sp. HITSZ_GF]MDG2533034.1 xanthine dehydrogenase accessory protein XdhC [Sphingomonas sp. HITSZ_GF]